MKRANGHDHWRAVCDAACRKRVIRDASYHIRDEKASVPEPEIAERQGNGVEGGDGNPRIVSPRAEAQPAPRIGQGERLQRPGKGIDDPEMADS